MITKLNPSVSHAEDTLLSTFGASAEIVALVAAEAELVDIEDIPALALHSAEDEETATCTYIYYYDHSLCELLVREETTPTADMGTALV
ncbi:MAG: DUF4860 domain-containing protein [Clostridiales bacterium]|nr:DUF4860 domain-containing protein [Clostridiales bacterium]